MGDSAGAGIGLTVGILSSPQWWRRRAPLCAIAATSLPLPYSHVAKHDSCKAYGKNYMMEASFFELCWNAYMGPLKHNGDWRASPMQAPSSKLQKLRGTPILLAVAEVHTTYVYIDACYYYLPQSPLPIFNPCFLLFVISARDFP